jgi:hypothetical protein
MPADGHVLPHDHLRGLIPTVWRLLARPKSDDSIPETG